MVKRNYFANLNWQFCARIKRRGGLQWRHHIPSGVWVGGVHTPRTPHITLGAAICAARASRGGRPLVRCPDQTSPPTEVVSWIVRSILTLAVQLLRHRLSTDYNQRVAPSHCKPVAASYLLCLLVVLIGQMSIFGGSTRRRQAIIISN